MRFAAVGVALVLLAFTQIPAMAAPSRSLGCTQTTATRPQLVRSVSGAVDDTDTLLAATVTRVATGATEISASNPALDNAFLGGYYLTHDQWNTWLLGTVHVGSEPETYYLMVPTTALPTGQRVSGLLYLSFNNGSDGSDQFGLSCTAN